MKNFILFLIIFLGSMLRLYNLSTNPPSLYWDEASLGYNAYSILKSGMDEHGENMPLARFMAFGDYKPPGYIYASVASIAFFGLNEIGIRFPSALSGILMILLTFLIAKEIFKSAKISLLSAFVFAVSPWSIHLSRIAFEANLAALFNLSGIYFFVKGRKKGIFIVISMISFLLSFYTFNANRIITPLMYLILTTIYMKSLKVNKKWHILSLILAVILLLPSVGFLKSQESRLRFQEVSIFNNLNPIILSNQRIALDRDSFVSNLIHNRRVFFIKDYLKHFFDNFSGRFLFTHGDVNPRLSVQGMGQLYFFDFPFFVLGLLYLIRKRDKISLLIFSWMIISVIPAGTARETPHALRIVSVLPAYQLIIGIGLYKFFSKLKNVLSGKNLNISSSFISLIFAINCLFYLHIYHIHFPVDWSGEFQYGTKEMVDFVNSIKSKYDRIFVASEIGRPYIFFAFYSPIDPIEMQKNKTSSRDVFGFWEVSKLGNIIFNLSDTSSTKERSLVVSTSDSLPDNYRILNIVRNLKGDPVFYIGDNI